MISFSYYCFQSDGIFLDPDDCYARFASSTFSAAGGAAASVGGGVRFGSAAVASVALSAALFSIFGTGSSSPVTASLAALSAALRASSDVFF